MGIELEWVPKVNCKKGEKFNNFYLAHFNSNSKVTNSHEITWVKALKEIDTNFLNCETENSNGLYCNLLAVPGIFNPISSVSRGIRKQLKKMVGIEDENGSFSTFKSFKSTFRISLNFSLSFFKKKYSHNWKIIFAHLLEKSNLLVRSDNNTGFFSPEILQTTTI